MPDPIDTCSWTLIRITIGALRDGLEAAGYQPSLANVERIMNKVGLQPSLDGLSAQRDALIAAMINQTPDLEQRAQEIDDAE